MGQAELQPGDTIDSGHREIADGVFAIKECIIKSPISDPVDEMREWYEPNRGLHSSQTAYLITGDENLLFDTLTPVGDGFILKNLKEILGDETLDYLVISHPEANHAGNTEAILDEYPDATLVAPARGIQHDVFGLGGDTVYVSDGDTIDLGDNTIRFEEPVFYDHAMTVWMRELRHNILFTVDWMGYEHMDSDCLCFNDELTHELTYNQLDRFNGYAFVWYRFVDPDRTDEAVERVKADLPEMIAPAHGEIIRENVAEHLDVMKSVIRDISETGTDYHIHTHQMSSPFAKKEN